MKNFTEARRALIRQCYYSHVEAIGPSLGISYVCRMSLQSDAQCGPMCELSLGGTCKHYRSIPPKRNRK